MKSTLAFAFYICFSALLACVASDFCDSNPCQNGGNCLTNLSICDCTSTGYTDPLCSTKITCPAMQSDNSIWPKAPSSTKVFGACSSGYIGQPSRMCQDNGTWSDLLTICYSNSYTCTPQPYANAYWPETPVATTSSGNCMLGYSGSPTRKCLIDGTWSTALATYCQRNQCTGTTESNGVWPTTVSLARATGTCQPGFYGSIQRTCNSDGTWGAINGTCLPSTPCLAETYGKTNWSTTNSGDTATGICSPGFQGNPTRICSSNGVWQTLISNPCTRIQCPASSITILGNVIVSYPVSLSNTNVAGVCPQTLSGKPYRFCDLNGNWATTVVGTCK